MAAVEKLEPGSRDNAVSSPLTSELQAPLTANVELSRWPSSQSRSSLDAASGIAGRNRPLPAFGGVFGGGITTQAPPNVPEQPTGDSHMEEASGRFGFATLKFSMLNPATWNHESRDLSTKDLVTSRRQPSPTLERGANQARDTGLVDGIGFERGRSNFLDILRVFDPLPRRPTLGEDEELAACGDIMDVPVLQCDRDWAEAVGISSDSDDSDDSDRPARPGRRKRCSVTPLQSERRPQSMCGQDRSASLSNVGVVDVVQISSEWAGFGSMDDSDEDVSLKKARRNPSLQCTVSPVCTTNPPSEKANVSNCSATVCKHWMYFIAQSVLHVSDFVLRTCCLFIYAMDEELRKVLVLLIPLQVLGAVVCTYIAFHDADVLLTLHWVVGVVPRLRCLLVAGACLTLGFCQVIQVKRAWAGQLHDAEVLTDWGDRGEITTERSSASKGFAGAQNVMPVALVTGVPFLIVNWLSDATDYRGQYCFWTTSTDSSIIHTWATIVLVFTVSMGVVEIDRSVSIYCRDRYHMNPKISGERAGHFQCLYPVAHVLFRASEVCLRALVMSGYLNLPKYILKDSPTLLALLAIGTDYVVGVVLLYRYSPSKENCVVHLLAGVGMLVADLSYFVDEPNFAMPARSIRHSMRIWRLLVFSVVTLGNIAVWLAMTYLGTQMCFFWERRLLILLGATVVHYGLLCSPMISRVGDDLHTAAKSSNRDRIRRLLVPDSAGQVLDVNAPTKDNDRLTPLMCAAEAGHVGILKILVRAGADVNETSADGSTCLHLAARRLQVEACQFLVTAGADYEKRNHRGEMPIDLLPSRASRSLTEEETNRVRLALISERPGGVTASGSNTSSSPDKADKQYYSVIASPCAGMQLKNLFPDVDNDDAPPPCACQSVSALVVSRAAGPLSHRVLARADETHSSLPLGALRRVRELGKGGFGRVIEVELPVDAAGTFWRRQLRPRRFALKLQLKQEGRQARSEVQALRRADHPFIVRLERAFQTPKYFALLLELCPTDLNRLICVADDSGRCPGLSPPVVAKYMGQVVLALTHLHMNERIVYRDVKPENILISERDEAKLTDFGLAKVVTSADRMTMCGTVGFLPPEMMTVPCNGPSGADIGGSRSSLGTAVPSRGGKLDPYTDACFKTDAFSFGVTLQVALLGEDGARCKTIRRKGRMMLPLHLDESETIEMLSNLTECGRLPREAFSLLQRLLPFDPAMRSSLCDVLSDEFFLKTLNCDDLQEFLITRSVSDNSPMSYWWQKRGQQQQQDSASVANMKAS